MCVEIVRIIDSYSIGSHQHSWERTHLLLLIIPHPPYNTNCNHYQPYKQYPTKHRKHNNQHTTRRLHRIPYINDNSIGIQIEKRYRHIVATPRTDRYRILSIVLSELSQPWNSRIHQPCDLTLEIFELDSVNYVYIGGCVV